MSVNIRYEDKQLSIFSHLVNIIGIARFLVKCNIVVDGNNTGVNFPFKFSEVTG